MVRSTVDALSTIENFKKYGVAFHSIQEKIDTKSATGKFFYTLLAALGEMERGIIGERTRAALQHKKAKNEFIGGQPPYGFKIVINADGVKVLEPHEYEQEAIRAMKALHKKGYSLRKIAASLENDNKRPRGATWNLNTISAITKKAA
jgi:DNA invertase Pin-like site-specific DNA recombinase